MSVSPHEFFEEDFVMIRFSKKQTGDKGEDYAVRYLKKQGCKILDRNYRKKYGEIDIIARENNCLLFVEVKTRHSGSLTEPYQAVTYRKQRNIIMTAKAYLAEMKSEACCRFDVCEVFVDENTLKLDRIRYIKNAFTNDNHGAKR